MTGQNYEIYNIMENGFIIGTRTSPISFKSKFCKESIYLMFELVKILTDFYFFDKGSVELH